jgi:predicted nucleic acid-binding protein
MIVLDTNVISEAMRATPDSRVHAWLQGKKLFDLSLSTITIAEIQRGLKRLPAGRRQADLEQRFGDFVGRGFGGRILTFDEDCATLYGDLCRLREAKGLHADPIDMMIAAVARNANAALATRNIADFESCGLRLINPWMESA